MDILLNALRAAAVRRAIPACGLLAAALALSGCATTYELTLMPRDSGTLSFGRAQSTGGGLASVSIALGAKVYNGNWVEVVQDRSATYALGGGRLGRGYYDGGVVLDHGSEDSIAKALLQAADGSGLRCDFFGLNGGQGTGRCIDDKGLVYDVQIRSRNSK
jgi:hypothetical protein